MCSHATSSSSIASAESDYRSAFERLKQRKTVRLPLGASVTQNNVAREAGRDPSALKKDRYPRLVREIKHWIEQNAGQSPPSARQSMLASRKRNRSLKDKIADLKAQRDVAVSKLLEADAKILELTLENARLQALSQQQ